LNARTDGISIDRAAWLNVRFIGDPFYRLITR
jgi:hypothetical protein